MKISYLDFMSNSAYSLDSFFIISEFWRYPMANPRQSIKIEDESPSSLSTTMPLKESTPQMQNTSFLGSSSSNSPASSLSSFESSKLFVLLSVKFLYTV